MYTCVLNSSRRMDTVRLIHQAPGEAFIEQLHSWGLGSFCTVAVQWGLRTWLFQWIRDWMFGRFSNIYIYIYNIYIYTHHIIILGCWDTLRDHTGILGYIWG